MQKGHCNVPSRYAEDRRLGKWVQKLREKKTELDKKGLDFELPKGKLTGRTLTKERIDKLDSLGFEWRIKTKPRVSWDERFEELVQFYNMNGRWPSRSTDGEIGTWTHNQVCACASVLLVYALWFVLDIIMTMSGRYGADLVLLVSQHNIVLVTLQRNLHTKKDKHFMVERFTKLEAIGFDWDPTGKRAAKELSWSDGFGQLVSEILIVSTNYPFTCAVVVCVVFAPYEYNTIYITHRASSPTVKRLILDRPTDISMFHLLIGMIRMAVVSIGLPKHFIWSTGRSRMVKRHGC